MPPLSYKKGKAANIIKEKDMERMATYFLILCDQLKLDRNMHKMAAGEIGSTPDSMSVMTGALLKKLRDADCYIVDGEAGTDAMPTPKATPKKSTPKKRKGDGDANGSPPPKKAARGKKDAEKGTPEATKEDAIKDEEDF